MRPEPKPARGHRRRRVARRVGCRREGHGTTGRVASGGLSLGLLRRGPAVVARTFETRARRAYRRRLMGLRPDARFGAVRTPAERPRAASFEAALDAWRDREIRG